MTSYNSRSTIEECLKSIYAQEYPRELLEVIIVDGGSKDGTIEIAKSYPATIISERTGKPETATAIGMLKAKNELVISIASDNVLTHPRWLLSMVEPFCIEEVVAAQPLWYKYIKDDSLLNRYFTLYGVNDPVPYYMKKQDRVSWVEKNWRLSGKSEDMGNYFIVRFNEFEIPTLGANGYVVRKNIIQKVINNNPGNFFHIDINVDMIIRGYRVYAIVKTDIWHRTGSTLLEFLRKRVRYGAIFFKDLSKRRFRYVHNKSDLRKLLLFVIYSLTIFKPTLDALRGYKKLPDVAWLIHPVVCFMFLIIYGTLFSTLKLRLATNFW